MIRGSWDCQSIAETNKCSMSCCDMAWCVGHAMLGENNFIFSLFLGNFLLSVFFKSLNGLVCWIFWDWANIFLILLIFQITVYENLPKDGPWFAGVGKLLFSMFKKRGLFGLARLLFLKFSLNIFSLGVTLHFFFPCPPHSSVGVTLEIRVAEEVFKLMAVQWIAGLGTFEALFYYFAPFISLGVTLYFFFPCPPYF